MSLTNVLGLCNMHDSPYIGQITNSRPLGVLSFLSRYALMDFTLSNFSNSRIDKVGILCRQHPQSVLQHLGNGTAWNSNTKTGIFSLLYSERGTLNQRFNTDIANIKENIWIVKRSNPDYIILAPSHVIYAIDFRTYLAKHIKSGASVSMIYIKSNKLESEHLTRQIIDIDNDGFLVDSRENIGDAPKGNVSLNMFIINRDTFNLILETSNKVSLLYGFSEMIRYLQKNEMIKVLAQEYKGYVREIDSLQHYFAYSLELLKYQNRSKLLDIHPIYTTTRDTPPARYSSGANVHNSFIANGAQINGLIENCIIGRDVVVSKGAKIRNSIILSGTCIGENVILENVIIDKNSHIENAKIIKGESEDPIYISQGVKV